MKYKVGDKVRIKSLDWYNENKSKSHGTVACGGKYFEYDMREWCGKIMTILEVYQTCYIMEEDGAKDLWTDEMIEGLVEEEEIEFTEEDKYWCDIMSESDPTTYVLPQGYQFVDENGNVIETKKIVLEKKKPKYPKTYEECLKVLGFNTTRKVKESSVFDYDDDIVALQKLKRCRDAYWKIAGEEMGLGKSWEPDWCNDNQFKYIIICRRDNVIKDTYTAKNCILAFPTEEMRDAFYEAFKEDIEKCKELL